MRSHAGWLAAACLALAATPSARAAFQAPGETQRAPTLPELRASAAQLVEQGRYADAEARLVPYLQRAPSDHAAWNLLGVSQYALKRYHQAVESFSKCASLGPPHAEAFTNLGVAQFLCERHADAKKSFERALQLDEHHSRSQLFLGRIALLAGDVETAERSFRTAVGVALPDPTALFHYGVFLVQERRLVEARAMLQRCIQLDENYGSAHRMLGLVLRRTGDEAGAQRHLQRFVELTEIEVGAERQLMRVTALLRAAYKDIEDGNMEAALAAALEALDIAPKFPIVHQTVSDIYRRLGRTDLAQAAADRARELAEERAKAADPASKGDGR